jgi:hypothetical protein
MWGGNAQNVPLTITPPTPYTLSPPLKGGEGGSCTHLPYPFGVLLVTLYQISEYELVVFCGAAAQNISLHLEGF